MQRDITDVCEVSRYVRLEVVDAHQRQAGGCMIGLGRAYADQQRSYQARAVGDSDASQVAPGGAGLLQSLFSHADQYLGMLS